MAKNQDLKPIRNLKSSETPEGLFGKIMDKIQREKEVRLARRHLFIFSGAAGVSFVAGFSALGMIWTNVAHSALLQLLGSIISDPKLIFTSWFDAGLLFLESFPVVSIALFLATALVFLGSLKYLINNLQILSKQTPRIISN